MNIIKLFKMKKAYHDKQKKNLDEDISLMQKLKLDVVNDRKQFEEEKKNLIDKLLII